MKTCPACGETKPYEEFYAEPKRAGDGYSSQCKECARARKRKYFAEQYYPANKASIIQAVIERRKANS